MILRLSWSSLPTCLNILISDYSSVRSVNVWNQGNWGAWTRTGPSWWCLMPPDGAMKVMNLWSSQGQIHLYRMDNICWLVKAVSGKSWVKDWQPKFLRIESPQSRWKGVWFNSSSDLKFGPLGPTMWYLFSVCCEILGSESCWKMWADYGQGCSWEVSGFLPGTVKQQSTLLF